MGSFKFIQILIKQKIKALGFLKIHDNGIKHVVKWFWRRFTSMKCITNLYGLSWWEDIVFVVGWCGEVRLWKLLPSVSRHPHQNQHQSNVFWIVWSMCLISQYLWSPLLSTILYSLYVTSCNLASQNMGLWKKLNMDDSHNILWDNRRVDSICV